MPTYASCIEAYVPYHERHAEAAASVRAAEAERAEQRHEALSALRLALATLAAGTPTNGYVEVLASTRWWERRRRLRSFVANEVVEVYRFPRVFSMPPICDAHERWWDAHVSVEGRVWRSHVGSRPETRRIIQVDAGVALQDLTRDEATRLLDAVRRGPSGAGVQT